MVDALLESPKPDTDWQAVRREHLTQLSFFQHERLVHLIVTMTVALLELLSLCLFVYCCSTGNGSVIGSGALCVVFLGLLIPYIGHYYLLENKVQEMYAQYDRIMERIDSITNHAKEPE